MNSSYDKTLILRVTWRANQHSLRALFIMIHP